MGDLPVDGESLALMQSGQQMEIDKFCLHK
jgi:hypothetical protein